MRQNYTQGQAKYSPRRRENRAPRKPKPKTSEKNPEKTNPPKRNRCDGERIPDAPVFSFSPAFLRKKRKIFCYKEKNSLHFTLHFIKNARFFRERDLLFLFQKPFDPFAKKGKPAEERALLTGDIHAQKVCAVPAI